MNEPLKVPMMTSKMGSQLPREPRITAPELDEAIIAKPLVNSDFMDPKPKNPNVSFRWIEFKAQDGLRLSQAQSQGWQTVVASDLVDPKSPYSRDGGSKFINGDLILMKIDRGRYLGALKHKHQLAAALNDPTILKTVSAQKATASLAAAGAGRKDVQGKISVFTPGASDLVGTPLADPKAVSELARLGSDAPPEVGGKGV